HVALDLLLDVPRRVDDLSPATDQRLEVLDGRHKAEPTGARIPTGRRAGPAPAPDAAPPAGSRAPSQWSPDARCAVHRAAQLVVVPGEHTAAAGNTERARQQQRDRRLPSAALRVGHYERHSAAEAHATSQLRLSFPGQFHCRRRDLRLPKVVSQAVGLTGARMAVVRRVYE